MSNLDSKDKWNNYYDKEIGRGIFKYDRYMLVKIKHILLHKKNIKTVLDLGCGSGKLVFMLNESGFKCKGIDYSDRIINWLNHNYKNNFYNKDINKFNKFPKIDAIILNNTLEYINSSILDMLNTFTIIVLSKKSNIYNIYNKLLLEKNFRKAELTDIPEEFRHVRCELLESIYVSE